MSYYEKKEIKGAAESQKEEILNNYDELASAKIFFDGKGNFAVLTELSKGTEVIAALGGETGQKAEAVFLNTLKKGANEFCDYLKECYIKAATSREDEFKEILRKLGIL